MKKIKRLCKLLPITLLFMVLSVGVAFANNLKNNPIDESYSISRSIQYLSGTTFSIANDNAIIPEKSYFLLSEVVFGNTLANLEIGNSYKEAMGIWNNGGTMSEPRFTILSNPALLESSYKEKTDNVNRLIVRTPKKGERIFKINVSGYKPNSKFELIFKMEEIAGCGEKSDFEIKVNNVLIDDKSKFNLQSNQSKKINIYTSSGISESQFSI